MQKNIFEVLEDEFRHKPGGQHVILAGACQGDDLEKLIVALPKARVYAFEPDPRNFAKLLKKQWPSRVSLFPGAIADKPGMMQFRQSLGHPETGKPDWTQSGSLLAPKEHLKHHPWCKFADPIEVPVVSIDQFCEENKITPTLIYADVQGAEALMLKGAQATLPKVEYLFTEYAETEEYAGQPDLNAIFKLLPGTWEVLADWRHCYEKGTNKLYLGDVLLKNTAIEQSTGGNDAAGNKPAANQ